DATVAKYQKQLHQEIPRDLQRLVTRKSRNLNYLRRGHTNVVFRLDLALGINKNRAERRQQLLGSRERDAESADILAEARGEAAAQRQEQVESEGAEAQLRMRRNKEKAQAYSPKQIGYDPKRRNSQKHEQNGRGPNRGRMTRN